LVSAVRDNDWLTVHNLCRQSRRFVLPATIVLSLGLIITFYAFTTWVIPSDKGLQDGLTSLVILLIGVVFVCFLVPFDQLLMMSGHPGYQTAQQLAMVGTNIALAALLLPIYGIEGAAVGTAVSYVAGISVMLFFVRRVLGWNLVGNKKE
jgi:O-antigen/teichoic acid export membrane protein